MLEELCGQIAHRGPDDRGVYVSEDCCAGIWATRLSIIDLAQGLQPLADRRGAHWIAFNGEIYNYLELRDELAAAGWPFRTHSDTEVVLAAYTTSGRDCLHRFIDMFGLAV